jgi:hypothetical protein
MDKVKKKESGNVRPSPKEKSEENDVKWNDSFNWIELACVRAQCKWGVEPRVSDSTVRFALKASWVTSHSVKVVVAPRRGFYCFMCLVVVYCSCI